MSQPVTDVWLVVVDDDPFTAESLSDRLGEDYPVFYFSDAVRAAAFIGGDHAQAREGVPSERPLGYVVLADLFLGFHGPSGISTAAALLDLGQSISLVIRSSELDSGRALLAIACAEIWRVRTGEPAVPYLPKDVTTSVIDLFRQGIERWRSDLQRSPGAHADFQGLHHVKPLEFVDAVGTRISFLEWLTKTPWRLEYLRLLSNRASPREAARASFAPSQAVDIDKQLRPFLAAHWALAPSGRWLDHDGLIDASAASRIPGVQLDHPGGQHLVLVQNFAQAERFLLASDGLREDLAKVDRARG